MKDYNQRSVKSYLQCELVIWAPSDIMPKTQDEMDYVVST